MAILFCSPKEFENLPRKEGEERIIVDTLKEGINNMLHLTYNFVGLDNQLVVIIQDDPETILKAGQIYSLLMQYEVARPAKIAHYYDSLIEKVEQLPTEYSVDKKVNEASTFLYF